MNTAVEQRPESVRLPEVPHALTIVILLAIAAAFAVRNLPWHLDNYDQAKQAFASWEIASTGHFWFQHTPRGDIATKPPLMAWISSALAVGFRLPWEIAWRLPSLAAALLVIRGLSREGGRIGGSSGSLLAISAFALTLLTPRLATLVRTDMVLTATVFGAGLMGYRRIGSDSPWSARSRWSLAAVVAFSCFLKGPIIFAFVFAPAALIAISARWKNRAALRAAWPGLWPWIAGLLPFLAWAIWGSLADDAFREQVIVREFAGRFTVGEHAVHNNQPVWFYLVHLTHKLLPWSLALAAALIHPLVRRRLASNPRAVFLLAWAGLALLIMSLVPSKRVDRIFPIVPILALLIPHTLVAAVGALNWTPARTLRIATTLIMLSLIISAGYAFTKPVFAASAGHADLAAFGRRTRASIQEENLRTATVNPAHEGLYLYLRGTLVCGEKHAAQLWSRNEIDAIVISRRRLEKIRKRLGEFQTTDTVSSGLGKRRTYLFLRRPEPDEESTDPPNSS